MTSPLWIYSHPFTFHLCCWWIIKIIPNQPIQNTNIFCLPLYPPPTTPLVCPFYKLDNILRLIIFLSTPKTNYYLSSIPKTRGRGGRVNMMWTTHKPNIQQHMQIHGKKLPYLWKQENLTNPWIHLGSSNRNTNLELYLINLSNPTSTTPTNNIHHHISKPLQNLPFLILIISTHFLLLSKYSITSSFKTFLPSQTPQFQIELSY